MMKTGSNDGRERAVNTAPHDGAEVTDEGQAAVDRERHRGRPQKSREPLHALIVHFDARGSSDPPPMGEED
jgi:hypothetical protein